MSLARQLLELIRLILALQALLCQFNFTFRVRCIPHVLEGCVCVCKSETVLYVKLSFKIIPEKTEVLFLLFWGIQAIPGSNLSWYACNLGELIINQYCAAP